MNTQEEYVITGVYPTLKLVSVEKVGETKQFTTKQYSIHLFKHIKKLRKGTIVKISVSEYNKQKEIKIEDI